MLGGVQGQLGPGGRPRHTTLAYQEGGTSKPRELSSSVMMVILSGKLAAGGAMTGKPSRRAALLDLGRRKRRQVRAQGEADDLPLLVQRDRARQRVHLALGELGVGHARRD